MTLQCTVLVTPASGGREGGDARVGELEGGDGGEEGEQGGARARQRVAVQRASRHRQPGKKVSHLIDLEF